MYVVPLLFFAIPLRVVEVNKNSDYLNFPLSNTIAPVPKKIYDISLSVCPKQAIWHMPFFFVHLSRNFVAKKLLET